MNLQLSFLVMNPKYLLIMLPLVKSNAVSAQAHKTTNCDVLKAFINDSVVIRKFQSCQSSLDTLFLIDTYGLFSDCDTFRAANKRLVIYQQQTNLDLSPNTFRNTEQWDNHIFVYRLFRQHRQITISGWCKLCNNYVMDIVYRIRKGKLITVARNGGNF
jgi:hypothetical protein